MTVHYELEGQPIAMLLDLVELAKSHSGVNLAIAFAQILEDFGIADKVLFYGQGIYIYILTLFLYTVPQYCL